MRKIRYPELEVPLQGLEGFHQEFLMERRAELQLLKDSLKALEYKPLAEMAHKWKGYSAPYGFQELALIAEILEDAALNDDFQKCHEGLKSVEDYLGQG